MPDSRLAVIVLAAGQGTRMRSKTPKLLHRLGGVPMIAHVLGTAGELDAAHVVTVVRHERDQLVRVIQEHLPSALVVDQDDVPGTGRAVELAVAQLPEDFDGDVLVVNGDVPLIDSGTLASLLERHRATGAAATLLSAVVDDPSGYGRIVRGDSGGLDAIVEERDASDTQRALREINAGVYVFGVSHLRDQLASLDAHNSQGEKYLTDVIALLRRAGMDVAAIEADRPELLSGVNDRAQLSEAAAKLNALIVRAWQLAGVTVHDPATTWIDITVSLATDVEILPGTQLRGATIVGEDAVIGPDTTLVDCEVGPRATVKRTDATLAVIGEDATVGPFAYLRPGTILGNQGKIGTFVETKNASIGDGSKVPHLSYVGDAVVGEHSNIGAGTIFANYDGVTKSTTEVGSHVRTGSHNTFVAPVRIGDGSYTGAGTVVRKDVPSGALAVNVAPQRNIADWVLTNRPGTETARAAETAQRGGENGETEQ